MIKGCNIGFYIIERRLVEHIDVTNRNPAAVDADELDVAYFNTLVDIAEQVQKKAKG